jgi:hypothetical protein
MIDVIEVKRNELNTCDDFIFRCHPKASPQVYKNDHAPLQVADGKVEIIPQMRDSTYAITVPYRTGLLLEEFDAANRGVLKCHVQSFLFDEEGIARFKHIHVANNSEEFYKRYQDYNSS